MQWLILTATIATMADVASNTPSLRVSLVVHNSTLSHLQATLRSLVVAVNVAKEAGVLGGVKLVVVDNRSERSYREALASCLSSVCEGNWLQDYELLLLGENVGFGAGHNAARYAGSHEEASERSPTVMRAMRESAPSPEASLSSLADDQNVLLLLNPDVELKNDALAVALETFVHEPACVALNPASRKADGRREYLCKRYPRPRVLLSRGFGHRRASGRQKRLEAAYEYRDRDPDQPGQVLLLSGACFFVRNRAFEEIGGFDEHYFMYFEDFDLSMRLQRLGQLRYEPRVQIVHHGGGAARKGFRHIRWFVASAMRFYRMHGLRSPAHALQEAGA